MESVLCPMAMDSSSIAQPCIVWYGRRYVGARDCQGYTACSSHWHAGLRKSLLDRNEQIISHISLGSHSGCACVGESCLCWRRSVCRTHCCSRAECHPWFRACQYLRMYKHVCGRLCQIYSVTIWQGLHGCARVNTALTKPTPKWCACIEQERAYSVPEQKSCATSALPTISAARAPLLSAIKRQQPACRSCRRMSA